jgi:hypothetical protein
MMSEQNERAAVIAEIRRAHKWTAKIPEYNKSRKPGDWRTALHLDVRTPEGDYIGVTWQSDGVFVCSDEMTEPFFEVTADFAEHSTNHVAIMAALYEIYAAINRRRAEKLADQASA